MDDMEVERRTLRLRAERREDVERAAEILRGGGTVAFPTETVYGLGANAMDAEAVEGIFRAKQRPSWDPLIVHVSDEDMLARVAKISGEVGRKARPLMDAFWPGPLTLLLPRTEAVQSLVTAGRPLVGVRMPRHETAMKLIRGAGVPLAAPSANRFGRTSPTCAEHVFEDLQGRIDAVLDGGATTVGVESTVLDVCRSPMVIYRPGAVTLEMIAGVAGEVKAFDVAEVASETEPASLPSPGVGLRHYAPRARLVLLRKLAGDSRMSLVEAIRREGADGIGVMLPEGWDGGSATQVYGWGRWNDGEMLARRLFDGLRTLDEAGAEVIVCPLPPAGGLGEALRDRLEKAARLK